MVPGKAIPAQGRSRLSGMAKTGIQRTPSQNKLMPPLTEPDNSEVSHKTVHDPLHRRPLTELSRKEKAIRIQNESPTDQYRRYSQGARALLQGLYRWLWRH